MVEKVREIHKVKSREIFALRTVLRQFLCLILVCLGVILSNT